MRTRQAWQTKAQHPAERLIFPALLAAAAFALVMCARQAEPIGVWVALFGISGWIIVLCLHEFAHAAVSYAGGDTSVRERGYFTLNPLRYTDIANSLVIPLILLLVGGIPLPGGAVLVEPGRLRHRWWASLVSAAGPAVNLVSGAGLAVVGAQFTSADSAVLGAALSFLGLLQFVTGVLNLLPIPGFDGFGILEPHLAPALLRTIAPWRPWLPLAAFALLWGIPGASGLLFELGYRLVDLVGGEPALAALGGQLFFFWR